MAGLETGHPPAFCVLKNGLMIGPMSEEELHAGVTEGRFERTDLVHVDGQEEWQPLERFLVAPLVEVLPVASVPDWKTILKWAGLRLRYSLTEQGKIAAPVCVVLGALFVVLSQWPILFWLPWFLVAAAAGVLLLRRKQAGFGAVVLVAVVCVPALLHYYVSKPRAEKQTRVVEGAQVESPAAPVGNTPAPVAINEPAPPEALTPVELVPAAPVASDLPPAPANTPSAAPVSMPAHYTRAAETPAPSITPAAASPAAVAPSEPKSESFFVSAGKLTDAAVSFFKGSKSSDSADTKEGSSASASSTPEPDLLQAHKESYVIVNGTNGAGSGFICRVGDKTWFFSNIHVMAELKQPVPTRLDNSVIVPGQTEAAAGRDIIRSLMLNPSAAPLEAMTNFEDNVHIGDEVMVLGNSGGGGVVTRLRGKIQGIGPDRIEVNAEFIPGNSGSPIVHVKSGKVVGIATYHTIRYEEFSSGAGDGMPKAGARLGRVVVRRFGYRIDNVPVWEPVNWANIHADADQLEAVSELTQDFYTMLGSVRGGGKMLATTSALRRPVMDWTAKMDNSRLNQRDHEMATQSFLNALRLLVRGDVAEAQARCHHTFFRNELKKQQMVRERMYEVFDRLLANRQSSLNAPAR